MVEDDPSLERNHNKFPGSRNQEDEENRRFEHINLSELHC